MTIMTEAEWLTSDDARRMWLWLCDDTPLRPPGWLGASERKRRLACQAVRNDVGLDLNHPFPWLLGYLGSGRAHPRVAAILRDLVGNPFRRPDLTWHEGKLLRLASRSFKPSNGPSSIMRKVWLPAYWLTPTVQSLALAAYDALGVECTTCRGHGFLLYQPMLRLSSRLPSPNESPSPPPVPDRRRCHTCKGMGRIHGGPTLDPVRLMVLADALEEAGCNEALTGHLRDSAPHYRGCWVLDLLLCKD